MDEKFILSAVGESLNKDKWIYEIIVYNEPVVLEISRKSLNLDESPELVAMILVNAETFYYWSIAERQERQEYRWHVSLPLIDPNSISTMFKHLGIDG